jgi:plasmid stabilization system protein ParE
VARVVYSTNALANLERAFDYLEPLAPEAGHAAVEAIRSAVEMLEHHPMIGRIVVGAPWGAPQADLSRHRLGERAGDLRELVISFGRTGYVALYRFLPGRDLVRVLAIRHQRELDYP